MFNKKEEDKKAFEVIFSEKITELDTKISKYSTLKLGVSTLIHNNPNVFQNVHMNLNHITLYLKEDDMPKDLFCEISKLNLVGVLRNELLYTIDNSTLYCIDLTVKK